VKFVKKLLLVVVVLAVIAILFPLSNYFYEPVETGTLAEVRSGDAEFAEVAAILEQKCTSCHLVEAKKPFYANFPVASGMVHEDVMAGIRHMNMTAELSSEPGNPISQAAITKIELVVEEGSMPPEHFLLMHWNGALNEEERERVLGWIRKVRQENFATDAAPEFANEPVQPLPLQVDLDPDKVALGDMLYHDVRLSGDDTISCASCHDLAKGGTDQAPTSTGIDGQVGPINSPTTYNSGEFVRQFWDGRAATLEEQAAGPVHNPIEMGASWEQVIPKLEKDPDYVKAFETLYPEDGLTGSTIVDAIATFERSLITPNSRFDQYLRGDEGAITDEEKQGYELFKSTGCATCHVGPAMGGQSFERMGLKADYFEDRGDVQEVDQGRFNFTKNEDDRFKFKVPSLRNIAVTYPYFHDGQTTDLKDAVKTMAKYQEGTELSDQDAELIVKFLKTLTGEYKGERLQ
jgi:cytochrome c peroxidase